MSLYDDASLIMYPSGYKSGKIYSQKPTNGSGDLTFTRASTATRVNPSGLIESVASGVPRIDYLNGCGQLLLEPQRTNIALYSNNLSDVYYSGASGASIVLDTNTSPDGTTNASTISFTSSTSVYQKILPGDYSNKTWTISCWVKVGSGSEGFRFKCTHGGVIDYFSSEKTATTEWQRFTFTVTFSATVGISIIYGLINSVSGSSKSIIVYGLQLEEGTYPTSYIPTAGSTVTRVADTSITIGLSSVINSVEGVLYAHWKMFANNLTNRFIAISDGTNNNRVFIGYSNVSNRLDVYVVSGGVMQAAMNYTLTDITVFHKIAIKYKANDFALWVNGVERATDVSGSTFASGTLNSFRLNEGVTISPFYGYIQDLGLFDVSTDLAELTTL